MLRGSPPEKRTARFRCVIALAWPDGRVEAGEGTAEGRILEALRGERGFGYDPLFFNELNATFSKVEAERKRLVSHRGKALARSRQVLQFDVKRQEGSGT